MRRVAISAPAKVNLFLRVMGRRPDGYHDIRTVFQSVDLFDDLTVELRDGGVRLDVLGPDLGPVEDNLAFRAAAAYRAGTGLASGVRIELTKRIPAGAGLGGGSSDAAAVLRSLAALTGDGDTVRLAEIGTGLGSDVPFFLRDASLALGTGRGERLEALPSLPEADLVLALPPVHVSTAEAYGALAASREDSDRDVGKTPEKPTVPIRTWDGVAESAHNDFEAIVVPMHGEIEESLTALRAAGARFALLSGSGAASFGLFDDSGTAIRAAARLTEELGWPCVPVRTLSAPPQPTSI